MDFHGGTQRGFRTGNPVSAQKLKFRNVTSPGQGHHLHKVVLKSCTPHVHSISFSGTQVGWAS